MYHRGAISIYPRRWKTSWFKIDAKLANEIHLREWGSVQISLQETAELDVPGPAPPSETGTNIEKGKWDAGQNTLEEKCWTEIADDNQQTPTHKWNWNMPWPDNVHWDGQARSSGYIHDG